VPVRITRSDAAAGMMEHQTALPFRVPVRKPESVS
jgi:hypothetical protein